MIMCKYRAILLFLLIIIYLNEVGARKNRNTRRKEKCTKPDKVSNARLKTRYERKEWFKDGDKVIYRCQPGYTMESTRNQRWCRKGNWTGVLFTCNQKCTKPDNVSNAELKTKYKRKERFNDGDSVEYKCQPGYTKDSKSRKRLCRKGNWTSVRFSCNLAADHPYRQSTPSQDLKEYGDISIDQILAKTNNKENVDDQEFELMELDIIVDERVKTPSSNRANINNDETRRWQPEIHYAIGDEISIEHENEIRKAIPVWQNYSCLSFSENKQAYNRIVFKLANNNECASSNVGMKQGPQTINLGETCFKTEIIVHEIGHALGFYHEHNRWDRDDYIKIHYENIEPGKNQSFQKQKNAVVDTNYDYLSIMHYGQYFFSRNESAKLITIETKNDTFQSKIGKAKQPSFQDYKTLNVMFKCADLCPTIECPEAGFVGKNCKCYCKGNSDDTPVKLCNKTGECRRPTVNTYLIDVMGKDKNSTVSINRTSFPDKTVLNLVSTNWECTSNSQLRCEDGDWKEISIAECPVTLNISFTDETEVVVNVTLNGVYEGYICDDDWDDNDATVACKMLGYTKGLAFFQKAKEVNESLPILLDNVQCSGKELSLADCKHNGWGNHDCEYLEVVSVKCFDDSYSNHINATTNITCGKIKLHNHNSKRKKRQVRVIGGLETEKGMHPWQVNIQRKKRGRIRNLCGGTIINKEWILSAAHCFEYQKKTAKLNITDIRVIVGDNDLTKHDEYEKMFEVEYIVRHWNYTDFKGKYNNNDIALLKVKSTGGITFNDYVQPACLPEDLTLPLSETKCEVSGWGKEHFLGDISDKLKAAEVPIISDHVCQSNYRNYSIDFEKVICAGDTTADACQGDSGGPLICNINGLSTVVGITSWGEGCGQKDSPGVYTKVSAYIKWINEQISNHGLEAKCAKPKPVQNAVLRDEYANKEKFKEGDKVEYDCELGYTIEGITRERWCRNTRWNEVGFTCNQITCTWVQHPDNGRHLDTSYAIGDVMKFECNVGYKLKGPDEILCRIDGQWSPPQGPTCDPILCPTLPQIQHGSIFQDTSDDLANNYESVAEYTCDRDYYLNGNTQLKTVKRTCQSDGKWSGKEPTCEVPKCNLIEDFYGGSVEYFGRRDLYSQAFYSCDENYTMIPSNVQHSTCENNLRWEPPPPKCFKKADRYVPKNGYLMGYLMRWKKGKILHDESYGICCDKGFMVERDDNVPVNKEECTNIRNNNGTLEPKVECVEVKCAKPKPVQNAVLRDEYANIETFKEGDKVKYDCDLGYTIEGITRERLCRNTKWTEVRFTCNQITCSWVPHPENGRHLDTTYAVGDVMKFECNIGYKLKGRDAILCRIDGQWSPPQGPTCDPILCPTLPQIQHGSIFQDTSDGLANNYESVAEYTCDRDYYLNGNTQLKTVRRTCQSDGKWSGNEPICEVPKCNLIDDFYGGSVEYFGRRDLYSQAFYSCDENYSMIPSIVQHSTCENNLRWEPPPPKCFKQADIYIPNNGYLWGRKKGKVLHDESYKICCHRRFEVEKDDIVPVNKESCSDIRNNNGTLEPKVECVEEWCEPDRRHTEYKHENGSEFTSRIPSNEDVLISCEKGYAFYNSRNKLLLSPQRRRCVQGQIKDTPTCNEAKSLLAGYPYNEFTFYQDRKGNRLDRETYIEPNERIEVYCSDGYELYVEFYQEYLDQFTTTSRHGSFDKEKNDFPVCREKRCNPNSLKHAGAKYENKTQVDFSTKIQGGTYIFVFCQDGFAFYDGNGQAIETMQKRQCMKGTIVDAPKCQEAKCSLAEYPSNQYTSYYNLNLKAIIEPKTDYIESSHKIQVNCTNSKEYELYVNASNKYVDTFKTKCNQGIFNRRKKMFPVCVEKRCSFEPSNAPGACFVTDDGGNCKREQFNIQSGSSMHIKCKQGYTLFVSKKEVKGQKIITCNKGSHPDFSCTANDCSAPGVNNTEPLSTTVYKHNEEVTYKCNKGYWFSKSKLGEKKIIFFKSTCSLGNWTNHIPRTCEPVACFLNVQAGTEYSIYGTGKDILNSSFVENGTSIGVRCKDGFDLYDDADTLINDTNVVPEVTCHVGEWSNKHWCKERCYIPNRANIQFSKDGENLTINDTIKHMESVNITCTGEQGTFSSFINCENGKFDQHDKCTSGNDLKSSISTSTISTASAENVNNQQQNVNEAPDDSLAEMEDYYDQIEEQRNKSKVSVNNSLIGSCRLPEMENMAKLNTRRTHYAIGETVRDFTCSRGYFLSSDKGMTCQNNGTWSDVITCVKGCNLSDDERYKYLNMKGDEIKPGDNLVVGDKLTVQCRFIDMYSYLTYDYDYIDADTPADDITISCKDDHTMTNIEKECPEEPKHDKCLKVVNGNVKISNSYYVVSCDKGFSLDIFEPEEKRSNCIDGKLKSVIGGQEPKCIPDRCKVPYEYDTRLSIYDKFRVSLSGGSVVEVGHFVYFNCSKAGDDMYEPVNRRFKCINGQWIEDERDKLWKFGNNGTFPECRKTICEPECENGGVCLRDDECKCKHFTSGKHCEDVLCDDKCKANNGECVGPGKCRCPQGKFGTNCELISCRPPEIENMAKLNPSRTHYAIGERIRDLTCNHGHFLSSDKGMTCQNNGTWSDVITCVKGIYYLIRAKTGTRTGAGTNANVFITLSGSGGSTRRINFGGRFESGDVDEIREFAKDIRPIDKVHIGHDGGIILPAWDVEYISIYVEHMEEFYVFRNNRRQWVEKDNDLTLHREGNKTCINSFDKGHLWYLDWQGLSFIRFGRAGKMSLRTCKQSCVNWKDEATQMQCVSVYYDHHHQACSGFTFDNHFFPVTRNRWNGRAYLRTCKHYDLVKRKLIDQV